jgi:integrase
MKSSSNRQNSGNRPRPHGQEWFVEDDQYRIVLDCLPDTLKPIFVLAYHLPLRKHELLSLRRDQVDLQSKRLLLNRQAGKCGGATAAPTYGDMLPWLDILLRKGETISPSTECLIVDDHGNPITNVSKAWSKAFQLAGVPRLLFRDMRRTAARHMFRCGFAESTIVAVAGVNNLTLMWSCTRTDKKDILAARRLLQRYFDQQGELAPRKVINVKPN